MDFLRSLSSQFLRFLFLRASKRQILRVREVGCVQRIGYFQNRVPSPKRVGYGFSGQRVSHPLPVHDETVFVGARGQSGFLEPMTAAREMHGFGGGLPLVEGASDANGGSRRMSELKANGNEFGAEVGEIIVVMIVFHFYFTFR